MNEKMGIKNLKEMVSLGLSIGQGAAKSMEDGKMSVADMTNFTGSILMVVPAIDGAGDIPAEIADMDDAESAELKQHVKDNFDIADDQLEVAIEESVGVALGIYSVIKRFKALGATEEPTETSEPTPTA